MVKAWHALAHEVPPWKRPYHLVKLYAAKYYLQWFFPKIDIIGIGGSVGKTTTKEALASVLKQKYRVKYSKANIDPIFNIPSTILSLRPGDQKLIVELGIEYPGDMAFYLSIVKPKTAILTRLTLEHPQFLGSLDAIIAHEAELVERLPKEGLAVLNIDDEHCRSLIPKIASQVITYAFGQTADFEGSQYRDTQNGSEFTIATTLGEIPVRWRLVGEHTAYAALAAAAVGSLYRLTNDEIKRGLELLQPPPSRMNVISYNGSTIINDAYNAMPEAMLAALDSLAKRPSSGRKIAVLATMKELGPYAEEMHRKVGAKVAEIAPDYVVLWGEHTNFMADEAMANGYPKDRIIVANSIQDIIDFLKKTIKPQDTVLLKGSRHHIHLERVAFFFEGQPPTVVCATCPECA